MTWDNNKYIKLLLERKQGQQDKYLIALRTTAEFYGWTEAFCEWESKVLFSDGHYSYCAHPGNKGEMFCEAGTRLRICRAPTRSGYPRGKTNSFKVSNNCTISDLAEVAHFTEGDWYWMSTPYGERIGRVRWDDIYQARIHQQRRGLVSA